MLAVNCIRDCVALVFRWLPEELQDRYRIGGPHLEKGSLHTEKLNYHKEFVLFIAAVPEPILLAFEMRQPQYTIESLIETHHRVGLKNKSNEIILGFEIDEKTLLLQLNFKIISRTLL